MRKCCAIEYLAGHYDHAVIMLQDPNGLAGSQYAAKQVKDEKSLLDTVSQWYESVESYSDSTDIAEADLYLFAPLTEFAELLKKSPSLKSNRAVLMAGDSAGPEGAGEEWNAMADPDAYRYVTENMTNLMQATRPDCEMNMRKTDTLFRCRFWTNI